MLLVLGALLVGSGAVSASETALFRLGHADRQRLAREHPAAARAVATLFRRPRALLITVLLLNMTINVTYFVVSSVLSYRVEGAVAAVVVGVGSLFAIILFGEVLAKLLASAHRVRYVSLIAMPLLAVHRAITPVRLVVDHVFVGPLSRLVAPADAQRASTVTADELGELLGVGASSGAIDEHEQTLLTDVLELGSLRVRDVMTPAIDVVCITPTLQIEHVLEAVRATGHTRYPISISGLDGEVTGVLNARSYLAAAENVRAASVAPGRHIEQAHYVPETARLDQLLDHFRRSSSRTSLAVDERGAITGWVQIEDVVEELVSLAQEDESLGFDEVQLVGLSTWLVPGRLTIHEWRDLFPSALPSMPRVSTIAGLITATLGHIPKPGDHVDVGNVRLTVDSMAGRVIEHVRVTLIDAEDVAASASSKGVEP